VTAARDVDAESVTTTVLTKWNSGIVEYTTGSIPLYNTLGQQETSTFQLFSRRNIFVSCSLGIVYLLY
jgi:hypothetical protein